MMARGPVEDPLAEAHARGLLGGTPSNPVLNNLRYNSALDYRYAYEIASRDVSEIGADSLAALRKKAEEQRKLERCRAALGPLRALVDGAVIFKRPVTDVARELNIGNPRHSAMPILHIGLDALADAL